MKRSRKIKAKLDAYLAHRTWREGEVFAVLSPDRVPLSEWVPRSS